MVRQESAKLLYGSSILPCASRLPRWWNGIHGGLKILWPQGLESSSLSLGTTQALVVQRIGRKLPKLVIVVRFHAGAQQPQEALGIRCHFCRKPIKEATPVIAARCLYYKVAVVEVSIDPRSSKVSSNIHPGCRVSGTSQIEGMLGTVARAAIFADAKFKGIIWTMCAYFGEVTLNANFYGNRCSI